MCDYKGEPNCDIFVAIFMCLYKIAHSLPSGQDLTVLEVTRIGLR